MTECLLNFIKHFFYIRTLKNIFNKFMILKSDNIKINQVLLNLFFIEFITETYNKIF